MRKFYKLSRTGKDKKPRNILVKTIFQGTIGLVLTRKICSSHSRQKTKYVQLKLYSQEAVKLVQPMRLQIRILKSVCNVVKSGKMQKFNKYTDVFRIFARFTNLFHKLKYIEYIKKIS